MVATSTEYELYDKSLLIEICLTTFLDSYYMIKPKVFFLGNQKAQWICLLHYSPNP